MTTPKRILILDDEQALRDVLAAELKREGYEVLAMESKREGYDLLFDWTPDLIMTDIASPEMDGWQFLKWVRANPFAARVRLMVVTGQAGDKVSQKVRELGAHHFVNKPYDYRKLLESIRKQFEKQGEPVWQTPGLTSELFEAGPAYALPWNLLVERWQEALVCSPYRTAVLGVADWRLDFAVDQRSLLTVGRFFRPIDPSMCFSSRRYHPLLEGYGVDNGLVYVAGPRNNHMQTSSRIIIASAEETDEILAGGVFAPDLNRFET